MSNNTITIDGSFGEGGGQILRTSLSLAMVTGKTLVMEKIRAGRAKPGLMRQHLTAVQAAAEVCGARVDGDAAGSQRLRFEPGPTRAGSYRFAVGTAGSCTLVLQTVLPALLQASGPSELELEGGTHNPLAPPFDFLQRSFLPQVARMTGARVTAELQRPGFYPAGGGRIRVGIEPRPAGAAAPPRFSLLERGDIVARQATAMLAHLRRNIAERELSVLRAALGLLETDVQVLQIADSAGPGNALTLALTGTAGVTEVITGFGQLGVSAETVAERVADEAAEYLAATAPVGKHLADQLLLPLALAGGGEFRTQALTEHTRTNLHVIRQFLPVQVRTETAADGSVRVVVGDGATDA